MTEDNNLLIKKALDKIKLLEDRLKIKPGFFKDLLKERNDWSFIISIHSLVEAAVSHYLSEKIGNDKLESVFQRVPLSTKHGGKIDFLRTLGLLEEFKDFIGLLSSIRNDYAHVISNVNLQFEDYFNFNKDNFNTCVKVFRKLMFLNYSKPEASEFVKKKARLAIWIVTMMLLLEAYADIENLSIDDT